MIAEAALCIFVKNPVEGRVKTRLAKATGASQALDIYRRLLHYTADKVEEADLMTYVYYADQIPAKEEFFPKRYPRRIQEGADLGQKMYNAMAALLQRHNKVVIIGSDCGELTADILHRAVRLLDIVDVVTGPARDGGYYLIGSKSANEELFSNIEWSTPHVLKQTIAKALEAQYDLALLPELRDVDTIDDWIALDW